MRADPCDAAQNHRQRRDRPHHEFERPEYRSRADIARGLEAGTTSEAKMATMVGTTMASMMATESIRRVLSAAPTGLADRGTAQSQPLRSSAAPNGDGLNAFQTPTPEEHSAPPRDSSPRLSQAKHHIGSFDMQTHPSRKLLRWSKSSMTWLKAPDQVSSPCAFVCLRRVD